MANRLPDRLLVWIRDAVTRFNGTPHLQYDSIHLDDLLGVPYLADSSFDDALACVNLLADLTPRFDYSFRVAVPLRTTATFEMAPPTLESARAAVDDMEPPSIYICQDLFVLYVPYFEEFRIPLDRGEFRASGTTLCYYTCFRSLGAASSGQNYSRNIWYDVMSGPAFQKYRELIGDSGST